MDGHRKERSTRQHLKIDSGLCLVREEEKGLLLANPMAACDVSPTNGVTQLTRSCERGSFKKSRPKSPSLLRFFVRSGSRKYSSADDEDDGSSGSDHEDPFSPRGMTDKAIPDLVHTNRYTDSSPKSARSDFETSRSQKRSPDGHSVFSHRDSGFASERDSVSRADERDCRAPSSSGEDWKILSEYRPGGMEALEMLHHQIQILAKSDCPDGEEEMDIQDHVITALRQQLSDMQESHECLTQSDHNMRLSLRLAEQRAMEAETKLSHSHNRCQRLEQRYTRLGTKYQALARKHRELEKIQQRQAIIQQMERVAQSQTSTRKSPRLPQRVHSQREFDREYTDSSNLHTNRPSTAQGIHTPPQPSRTGLSHTETCV